MEKNAKDILKLQDLLTQDILGIFWITKETLAETPRLFESMDYFMDGLLTRGSLPNEGGAYEGDEKTFFLTEHFGAPFFIGHIVESIRKMDQHFGEFMKLVGGFQGPRNKILVVGPQGERVQTFLKKKYPNYKFQTVTYKN